MVLPAMVLIVIALLALALGGTRWAAECDERAIHRMRNAGCRCPIGRLVILHRTGCPVIARRPRSAQ